MSVQGRRFLPALAIGLTLAVGILLGTVVSRGVRAAKVLPIGADAKPLPMPSPVELSNSFAKIADQLEPAVVNINTESTIKVARGRPRSRSNGDDSPFDDFFDRFFHFGPDGSGEFAVPDSQQRSLGSGVILDRNGYILTNYHVVMQSTEDKPVDRVYVYLHGNDHDKYRAKIVGEDKSTDLAVIRIDAGKPLTVAQLGDSESMRVGDWVLAIGSPFGLDSTVTAGIVSAKGREIEPGTEGQFKRFIQTDAAINPGNSGGPLVNLAGQVIGINTAIATRRGTYDGVGFAIPSNTVRKVYNSLITTGSVRRGAIGVSFNSDRNPALLRSFGTDHGVLVQTVEPDSPAGHAGLKRGDVILAVDGREIHSGDELVEIVSDTDIGKKLRIDYLRDEKRYSTQIEVGDRNKIVSERRELPDEENTEKPAGVEANGTLDVSAKNLTREQAQEIANQLRLDTREGILITDVKPGSFASDLGLRPHDILLTLNRHPVRSVEEFNQLQAQLKSGNDVLVLVARQSAPRGFTTQYFADRLP